MVQEVEKAASSYAAVYGRCINRFCKTGDPHLMVRHDTSGTLVDAMSGKTVIGANECSANREGLLCGQCKNGFALTTYYKVSQIAMHKGKGEPVLPANSLSLYNSERTSYFLLSKLLPLFIWDTFLGYLYQALSRQLEVFNILTFCCEISKTGQACSSSHSI